MGNNFTILMLGVDQASPGVFGVLQNTSLITTACHAELQGAWNHISTEDPADLVLISLASQGRQGCPIALSDVLSHLHTRWPDTPVVAVQTVGGSSQVSRTRELDVDEVLADVTHGEQLTSLVEKYLERALDRHIRDLNEQHIQIARSFRQLQQNCSLEQTRGLTQQILQVLESHFRFEEGFMASHGYARRHDHAAGHARMLAKAKTAIAACRMRDKDAASAAWQQVRSEMDTHILDDKAYLGFLEEMRQELGVQLRQPAVAV